MGKIFDMDFRTGSLIDLVGGKVGTPINLSFQRTEKGLALTDTLNLATADLTLDSSIVLTNSMSIEFWVKINKKSFQGILGLSTAGGASYLRFGQSVGLETFAIYGETDTNADAIDLDFNTPIKYGQYYHYIITINSSKQYNLYIDGVLQTNIAAPTDDLTFDQLMNSRDDDDNMYGSMARFRVYDHILTSEERAKLYSEFLNASPITRTIR
jgi:hypothetical protein